MCCRVLYLHVVHVCDVRTYDKRTKRGLYKSSKKTVFQTMDACVLYGGTTNELYSPRKYRGQIAILISSTHVVFVFRKSKYETKEKHFHLVNMLKKKKNPTDDRQSFAFPTPFYKS